MQKCQRPFLVLINPSNAVAQAVVARILETGDYFIFALGASGGVTPFRTEVDQEVLSGLKDNLFRMTHSTTPDSQYRQAVSAFMQNPEPAGVHRFGGWLSGKALP